MSTKIIHIVLFGEQGFLDWRDSSIFIFFEQFHLQNDNFISVLYHQTDDMVQRTTGPFFGYGKNTCFSQFVVTRSDLRLESRLTILKLSFPPGRNTIYESEPQWSKLRISCETLYQDMNHIIRDTSQDVTIVI